MSDDAIAIKPEKLTCGLIMPISQLENLPPAHWDEIKEIITKAVLFSPTAIFSSLGKSKSHLPTSKKKRTVNGLQNPWSTEC
jgi:hypothetical protein